MILNKLQIKNLRNITESRVEFSPRFNILVGNNGSGKTSFLESIYLLARGKSFRSSVNKRIVKQDEDSLTVFSQLSNSANQVHKIGIQIAAGRFLGKVDGHILKKSSLLASYLPLLLITPDADKLISGSPRQRRRFLDWGLFHVEQSFLACFQNYNRALLQRNNLLKAKSNTSQIEVWNAQLISYGEQLNHLRTTYAAKLSELSVSLFKELSGMENANFHYQKGWSEEKSLSESLTDAINTDLKFGFTQRGPHRADFVMKLDGKPASDILSGGQHKLAACSLIIAQANLYTRITKEPCVLLIDDLAAELDSARRALFLNMLDRSGCQVFISSTNAKDLETEKLSEIKMFHVEHGTITPN